MPRAGRKADAVEIKRFLDDFTGLDIPLKKTEARMRSFNIATAIEPGVGFCQSPGCVCATSSLLCSSRGRTSIDTSPVARLLPVRVRSIDEIAVDDLVARRFLLTLVGVAITVAFLMSSMTYHGILADLMTRTDVHTKAVLERAGAFTGDEESLRKQSHQRIWILALAAVLCVTGITNTMLMSVSERSGEIGTLKCLGSLNRFVVRLFLLESLLVGLIGSAAGALVGYLLGILQAGLSLEFSLLSPGHYLIPLLRWAPMAIGAGTVLTVISAAYPTYVAARMNPVEAMRVEI